MIKFIFKHFLIKSITDTKVSCLKSPFGAFDEFQQIALFQQRLIESMPKWYSRLIGKY